MAKHTNLTSLFAAIANAIRAKTGETAVIVADDFPSKIAEISTGIARRIVNDESITPSGSYATSTYYNTTYGVKVGYCPNGDILISMQGGTSTSYENIYFTLASAPSGVAIKTNNNTYDTSGDAGNIFACLISGLTVDATVSIAMGTINSSYDYVQCAITIKAV